MALRKKTPTGKVASPGYPPAFRHLVEEAATAYTTHKFFEERYGEVKDDLQTYIESDTCPFNVNVGEKGSNPRLDGLGIVILSQPERIDNQKAAAKVVELLQTGKMNVADLAEVISQANKDALSKLVEAATLQPLVVKTAEGELPLQGCVRVGGAYKAEIVSKLSSNFPRVKSAAEVTLVQPDPTAPLSPVTNEAVQKLRSRSSRKAAVQA